MIIISVLVYIIVNKVNLFVSVFLSSKLTVGLKIMWHVHISPIGLLAVPCTESLFMS